MAILLKRIESKVVLNKVASRIGKKISKLPIFAIHDCRVTTLGNENYVKVILEQESLSLIGVLPTTKFKYWQLEENNTKVLKMGNSRAA